MIVSLRGIIIEKLPTEVIIDVGGIGYLCYITTNTYDNLPKLNSEVFLFTYQQISENNQSLYGFSTKFDKEIFLMLISVSGIGPKTAINMLSSVSTDEFKRRIISADVDMLSSLPGIGPKTAKRIIIELKDKFIDSSYDTLVETDDNNEIYRDAYNALKLLGFNNNEINKVLNKLISKDNNLGMQDLLKKALALLRK